MEVLTRGSIDEGPIVLALPPIFEGLLPEGVTTETDPIFTAWDKTTGISIYKDQIVDRSYFATQAELDLLPTDTDVASAISANNADYIPYSGATTDVDLGTHTLHLGRAYAAQETPIASTEYATKGYADALAFNGAGGITPTVAHNDTTGKEGGGNGHWYHLSDTINAVIPNITQSGSDIVPTSLTLSDSGISAGVDGLAWVELTWDAIVSDTFDHYQIEYKKSSYTYYTPLSSTSNTITIEGLTPNTFYDFRVASVNRYGTSSAFSTDLTLITPSDSVAPATVTGVSATQAIQAVLLRWTHNTDVDLDSYNIYRYGSNNSVSATIVANFKGNVYMDNGLTANTTYYYWLKAVDTSGNESVAFSTECHATTKNVLATDIENIAANQVIIQGVTTLSNWVTPGVTTIDGSKITTGSVTLSQLNFTPITGGSIIATINASPEGIQIDADNFAVSGASTFTSKVGGSFTSSLTAPRVRIFPTTDIGIEVVDQYAVNVFKVEVGGTNVGDVTIGNWAGNQGIKYDRSANSTSFAGTILASAGSISGLLSFGTQTAAYGGFNSNVAISGSDIWENACDAENSSLHINRIGFNGGTTRYRSFIVYDGKGNQIFDVNGGVNSQINIGDGDDVYHSFIVLSGKTYTYGQLGIPTHTNTSQAALTAITGQIIYNSQTDHFYGQKSGGSWAQLDN